MSNISAFTLKIRRELKRRQKKCKWECIFPLEIYMSTGLLKKSIRHTLEFEEGSTGHWSWQSRIHPWWRGCCSAACDTETRSHKKRCKCFREVTIPPLPRPEIPWGSSRREREASFWIATITEKQRPRAMPCNRTSTWCHGKCCQCAQKQASPWWTNLHQLWVSADKFTT